LYLTSSLQAGDPRSREEGCHREALKAKNVFKFPECFAEVGLRAGPNRETVAQLSNFQLCEISVRDAVLKNLTFSI
jgi:hypothetical protein